MEFAPLRRKARSESIVPMINVVFLLLIFFLMTAQLSPPEPFPVQPPTAETGDPAEGTLTVYLSANGELGFAQARDDAAMRALQAAVANAPGTPVQVRADAQVPASALARLMPRLGQIGLTQVQLITVTP